MEDNNIDIRERLVAVESSLKSEHKWLDHLEEVVENIREMTAEIRHDYCFFYVSSRGAKQNKGEP